MKRIYIFALVASALISVCSCTRDPEPEHDGPERSGGYQTAEEAIAAAGMVSRIGAPTFYGECSASAVPAAMLGGYLSGYFTSESNADRALYESCRNLAFGDGRISDYAKKVWDKAYHAIGMCDELIVNIPRTSVLTEEQKSQIVADARFFRAFNYFYLVRTFGNVPVSDNRNGEIAVNDGISGVYELIVNDLKSALVAPPDKASTEGGLHVTRSAIQTLLADVYLTMSGWPLRHECYQQAVEMAEQVIQGGNHTLVSNGPTSDVSAWNLLRTRSDNTENIYSYSTENSEHSLVSFSLPEEAGTWGVVKAATGDVYMPSPALMNIYDNYVDMRSREQQFFHSFVKYEKDGRTVFQTFRTKPYWWFDRDALFETGISGRDVTIYRYAEVLLIAAEAIAMTEGVTSEAVSYLTDIRARAWSNVDRETISGELMALSTDEFLEEIWVERLREFPFEMKIWPDIQRTRKYPVTTPDDAGNVTFVDVIGASTPSNAVFGEKHLLLPIPQK